MDGLVGEIIGVQVLHDVDFGIFRSGKVRVRHEPERGPETPDTVELGLDFNTGFPEGLFPPTGHPARDKGRRIVFSARFSQEHQLTVFDEGEVFAEGHHVVPVAAALRNTGPGVFVNLWTVKVLFPNEIPFCFRRVPRAGGQDTDGGQRCEAVKEGSGFHIFSLCANLA